MDNTTETSDVRHTDLTGRVIISVIFGSIILIGIIGNMLVISLIVLVKKLHSVVNLCLGCLAVVDLMVLVFLPITPWLNLYDMGHSSLGRNFCIVLGPMDRPVLVCSVLIFLLIGVKRYTIVCHPLKSLGWWTRKKVCLLLVIIFVTSAGVAVPIGIVTRYDDADINGNRNLTNNRVDLINDQQLNDPILKTKSAIEKRLSRSRWKLYSYVPFSSRCDARGVPYSICYLQSAS
ncbi:alpha-1A adrenergic receptor-like [Liolophura sinensis]|uniref:alpha-1A adrenergic receptor-like n=1 Tax=Liolophura sinensis TaxID=3198878 RepID=UPI00315923FF